jgi:hypothetical protein
MTNNEDGPHMELAQDGEAIFENDHYEVVLMFVGPDGPPFTDGRWEYHSFYGVRNKRTEIIEHTCVQLPEAIFTTIGLDAALNKAPWKWAEDMAAAAATVN